MSRRPERRWRYRDGRPEHSAASRIVLGLAIAGVGAFFAMSNMGFVRAHDLLFRYWPVAFIAIGLSQLVDRCYRLSGAIFFFIGVLFLGRNLGWFPRVDFGVLFSLLLVFVGLILLKQSFDPRGKLLPGSSGNVVYMAAVMGGNVRRNVSSDFVGGDMIAIMGGSMLDLRQAKIDEREIVINALAFWGGIDIAIPSEWGVRVEAVPVLGGIVIRRPLPESASVTLVLRGTVIMGGIEVKN